MGPRRRWARRWATATAAVLAATAVVAAGPLPAASGDARLAAAPGGSPVQQVDPMDPIPPQYPFVCTTARSGLGQPKVDNQDGEGIPVAQEDANGDYPQDGRGYPTSAATIVGHSRDCEVDPVVEYRYRATDGSIRPLADPTGELPADIAEVTTTDGVTAPYIIRWERGTINRFLYSVAMLAPTTETDPADPRHDLWNGRVAFHFDGGVAIGRTQGVISQGSALYHEALSLGYAILYSSGTRTNTHYNLTVGGQTAVMVKDHFVATHGEPLYTVGVGGSGGGIQQYVYAQNHPGLLDGGVPQYSYPDMITQTIHVGDCELLEHHFENTDGDNERWRDVEERQKVHGLNSERQPRNLSAGDIEQWNLVYGLLYPAIGATPPRTEPGAPTPGLTECRPAWYGLTPLVLNPTFHNVSDVDKLAQGVDGVEWTHAADAVNVYGVDETGFARNPWDNVGVQYGLEAVAAGEITPEEFLDLNAYVGSWKEPSEMVPEGCPFDQSRCTDPSALDPWSRRQMDLSPGGTTPAPRRSGDVAAMNGAYEHGLVFRGAADIPFIDWRHYLEEELDMHNSSQSFATRQRMVDEQGHHDNQVIWFTDGRPQRQFDQTAQAFEVLHEWIMNIKDDPGAGVGGNRPAAAVDSCFATDGTLLHSGPDVWDGALGDGPPGPCTEAMPPYSTSRRVAGAPASGEVFKCQTKTVTQALRDGDYGDWTPSGGQVQRLEHIFPEGVCDYSEPDAGDPRTDVGPSPLDRFLAAAYAALMDRDPTPAEVDDARHRLTEEGLTRRALVEELRRHPDALALQVDRAYRAVLDRQPDGPGRDYWVARLSAGLTRTALVANLVNSGEFLAKAGGTSEDFVERAYQLLLGRGVDAAGLDHWVEALDRGTRRWFIARALYGSAESRRARVVAAYETYLGRSPDPGGLAHWTDLLRVRTDWDLMVTLLASPERFDRAQSGGS